MSLFYHVSNLHKNLPPFAALISRSAGSAVAGTLLLEFGLLSHLTGDRRFYVAAHDALNAVWSLRSERDLVGNTLDVRSREWTNPNAGIGAFRCFISQFSALPIQSRPRSCQASSFYSNAFSAPFVTMPPPP